MAGVRVRWTGSLSWPVPFGVDGTTPGPGRQWPARDDIAAPEPHLVAPPRALYVPTDGAVAPVHLTVAPVDAARAHGARVLLGRA